MYGYDGTELPVYFNQAPVLNAGGTARPRRGAAAESQRRPRPDRHAERRPAADRAVRARWRRGATRNRHGRPRAEEAAEVRERAQQRIRRARLASARASSCSSAPIRDELLLSGTLVNGQLLANRAAVVDDRVGDGHLVMFAIRPFWRWQTHGTYTLGFNAILNWNDLDAGK